MCEHCETTEQPTAIGRRGLLVGAAAAATAATMGVQPSAGASTPSRRGRWRPGQYGIEVLWLGVSGWQISIGDQRILIDPYLSRFEYRTSSGGIDPAAPLVTDERIVDAVVAEHLRVPPAFVLLSHGHWDHAADVPYLLNRTDPSEWSGPRWSDSIIRTVSTETTWHLIRAMGVSPLRTDDWIVARGGERLRFPPGPENEPETFSIRVIRSVHSQFGSYGYFAPGTRVAPPARPETIADLVDGETLGFQIEVPGRVKILFIGGTANLVDSEVIGLEPDVVIAGMSGYAAVHAYTERILNGTGEPAVVIPAHHDDLVTPLDSPALRSTVSPAPSVALREAIERMNMRTTVVEPEHLRPIRL